MIEYKKEIIAIPDNFISVKSINWDQPKIKFTFEIVADVNNPLLGENGSTYVFGKQKGLTELECKLIEYGFENLVKIFNQNDIGDPSKGLSGAGGGLAAGFQIFLNSRIRLF